MDRKRAFKTAFCILLCLIMVLSSFVTAFAGVASSGGSNSLGGGSGGAGSSADNKIGPGYSRGLRWVSHNGQLKWKTNVWMADKYGGSSFSVNEKTKKWACVQKHSTKSGWFNFRWEWYQAMNMRYPGYAVIGLTEDPNWAMYKHVWQNKSDSSGSICDRKGQLIPIDYLNEAIKNGFKFDSKKQWYWNPKTNKKLDIIWLAGEKKETEIKRGTTIVYAKIGDRVLLDRRHESAKSLYKYPTLSVPYSDKSQPNEFNHENKIEAIYTTVIRKVIVTHHSNGTTSTTIIYIRGGDTHDEKMIYYDVIQPEITQTYFNPFNLNRNGLAKVDDVKPSYPDYNGGLPLDMSIDNSQDITDNSHLKTLDTNVSLPFKMEFHNKQFGIPLESEGGFDLGDGIPGQSYKRGDNWYQTSVIPDLGSNGDTVTGEFYTDNNDPEEVDGKISKDLYWQGSIKLNLSANTASLTYKNEEKIGGETFSFVKGWKGGKFIFKTTKIGTYSLFNNGRKWWEAMYEQGKFYGYGVKYSGMITVGKIGEPNIDQTDLYAALASKNMIQPILTGTFEAKTVAGDLG